MLDSLTLAACNSERDAGPVERCCAGGSLVRLACVRNSS
jgi:hypothetical protein